MGVNAIVIRFFSKGDLILKMNLKKAVVLALSVSVFAISPVFAYSTSEATESPTVSGLNATAAATGTSADSASGNSAGRVPGSSGTGFFGGFSSIFSGASSGSAAPAAASPAQQNDTLNGVKSPTRGSYEAKSVPGITVNVIAVPAGIDSSKIYVRTWDVTEKGAPAAYACLKVAADSVGAVMGPTVEIDIRLRDGKDESELTGATSVLQIGIPKSFRKEGSGYGVARVVSGGTFTILDGEVSNNIITFTAPTGNAAYALLRYDN